MKKVYRIALVIAAFFGVYYFISDHSSPYKWTTTYSKDKFTDKEKIELFGLSKNRDGFGFACNNKAVTMIYGKDLSDQAAKEDFGDLYVKVDNHRQIKFEDTALINHHHFTGVQLYSDSYGQKMRELLIELQGVDKGIDVGFRGQELSYDANFSNDGLSEALIVFLDKCHIRLDQWPQQSPN